MMMREQIETKIRAEFDPLYLDVVDESYRHNVQADSESHFQIVLVSSRFNGELILNRHRAIYGALMEELVGPVYALVLHAYTVKEWEEGMRDTMPASPPCRSTGFTAFKVSSPRFATGLGCVLRRGRQYSNLSDLLDL